MNLYHNRIQDYYESKGGFLPPQIGAFMRNRGAPDCNMVRKAVREDAEQAISNNLDAALGITCTNYQKFYDSVTGDGKQLALLTPGAPLMLQKVLAETTC